MIFALIFSLTINCENDNFRQGIIFRHLDNIKFRIQLIFVGIGGN